MLSNLHAIDRSGISGCIIANLCGLLIQAIDRRLLPIRFIPQSSNIRLVCRRLRHGRINSCQCGGHVRAIADLPRHRQRACFDTVHAVQRLAISRESYGLAIQGSDIVFVRSDIACFEIINQFLNLFLSIGPRFGIGVRLYI